MPRELSVVERTELNHNALLAVLKACRMLLVFGGAGPVVSADGRYVAPRPGETFRVYRPTDGRRVDTGDGNQRLRMWAAATSRLTALVSFRW